MVAPEKAVRHFQTGSGTGVPQKGGAVLPGSVRVSSSAP